VFLFFGYSLPLVCGFKKGISRNNQVLGFPLPDMNNSRPFTASVKHFAKVFTGISETNDGIKKTNAKGIAESVPNVFICLLKICKSLKSVLRWGCKGSISYPSPPLENAL